MFKVNFNERAFEDGYIFKVTFMHGDADYDTVQTYHIDDEKTAVDFYEMLTEILHTRNIPHNRTYWVLGLGEENEREDLEMWADEWADGNAEESKKIVEEILNAKPPHWLTKETIRKVDFSIPWDNLEYDCQLASLICFDVIYIKDGIAYHVDTDQKY